MSSKLLTLELQISWDIEQELQIGKLKILNELIEKQKKSNIHGGLYPRSNRGRLYIPRVLGGGCLKPAVRYCVEEELLSVGKYIGNSSERFLKTGAEKLQFTKKMNTIKVQKRCQIECLERKLNSWSVCQRDRRILQTPKDGNCYRVGS